MEAESQSLALYPRFSAAASTALPLLLLCLSLLVSGSEAHAQTEIRRAIIPEGAEASPAVKPREVARGPSGLKQIALTFDAGSEADGFADLLRTLDDQLVPATFFLTGKWVQRFPDETEMLGRSPHVIGNHSWAHPEYTRLSDQQLLVDLMAADALLAQRFGRPIKPLFRAPFGERDQRVLRLLGASGYMSIYWTIDTLDSLEPRKSPQFIARRVIDRSDKEVDGAIILMHVGYPETCEALPLIIQNLRSRGYAFVTLKDWLQP